MHTGPEGKGSGEAARTVKERILLVDDDPQVLTLLQRILTREGYRCATAPSAEDASGELDRAPFDLLLCDVELPGASGLDFVERALARDVHMAALMVSGLDDVGYAEQALAVGAYGYVLKPFTANDVLIAVLGALRRRRHERGAEEELRESREETIRRLCIAVEARDPDTATHVEEMSESCGRIAGTLGLAAEHCALISTASAMHDVGKIGIPDQILLKPGPLTPEERLLMQQHAEIGYRILGGSRAELLQVAATIAWTHHERWDGDGYPRGLAGEAIPLEGRLAAVADVYDALTRDRVYRPRMPQGEALAIMRDGRGSQFDPQVLDAFLEAVSVSGARVS
jgi:putative two-component system response regulator